MKERPSFPARLDSTLAKNRPNVVGGLAKTAPALSVVAKAAPGAAAAPKSRAAAIPVPLGVGMDSQAVRQRMVQKLAGQGVTDPLVLQAMGAIERHRFVDSALVNQAYEDTSLPIGLGQTISKPGVVSRMIELLRNGATGRIGRVLEIGTGCGYQSAVLAELAKEVYTIEIVETWAAPRPRRSNVSATPTCTRGSATATRAGPSMRPSMRSSSRPRPITCRPRLSSN